MSYNTTIVPAKKAQALLFEAMEALLEQDTMLKHVSIEQYKSNEILFANCKCLNARLRFLVNQATRLTSCIADF
jgi:hypothetical protein